MLRGAYYKPVSFDRFVLGARAETGYIDGFDESVTQSNRFLLGGNKVRGFDGSGIGPRDNTSEGAVGGNQYYAGSFEIISNVGLNPDLGMRWTLFADYGSVWGTDFPTGVVGAEDDSMRQSIGFCILWDTAIGPLSFYWADPVSNQTYDKLREFQFTIGTRLKNYKVNAIGLWKGNIEYEKYSTMLIISYLYTLGLFILPSQKAYSQNNTIAVLQDTFNFERLAVVNMDKVLRDAKATERVRELLDNKREEFQNDFAMREANLLQIEKDLQSKRTILSEEAYRAEVNQFQNEVASIQQEIQFKRQALDKAFQEAQDEIKSLAAEIVTEIAGQQKLDVVLNKNAALVFRQDLDITEIVIIKLNERTKNARLEIQEE